MIFFFLALSLCLSSTLNLPFSLSLIQFSSFYISLTLPSFLTLWLSLSISLNFLFLVGYVFLFNSFLVPLFLALYFFFSSDFFLRACFSVSLCLTLSFSLSLPNHPTPSLSFYDLHFILFINVDTLLPTSDATRPKYFSLGMIGLRERHLHDVLLIKISTLNFDLKSSFITGSTNIIIPSHISLLWCLIVNSTKLLV